MFEEPFFFGHFFFYQKKISKIVLAVNVIKLRNVRTAGCVVSGLAAHGARAFFGGALSHGRSLGARLGHPASRGVLGCGSRLGRVGAFLARHWVADLSPDLAPHQSIKPRIGEQGR